MNILQFSIGGQPIPAIHGGAIQQTIEELSQALVKKNHNVTVITNANIKNKKELEEIDKKGVNYQYVYQKNQSKFPPVFQLPKYISKIIKNGPYDVVHIHVPIWIDLFNIIKNKIGNPKIIWHVHNRSRFSKLAERTIVNVVGISNSVLEGINRSTNETNVSVIPNICRHEKFPVLDYDETTKLKEQYNISKDSFIVGFAGRISPEKGLDVVLDALEMLNDKKITLLIAGSSWFKNAEKTQYEAEVYEKSKKIEVKWLGYVDNWELHKVYNVCDVFVVPSIWEEPAGQVVIEAQSCGTKVIASNVGGIPEFLSPYETTFEAGNAEELYNKIKEEILDNNRFDAEAKRNRSSWVRERYNIDIISDMWIKNYEK